MEYLLNGDVLASGSAEAQGMLGRAHKQSQRPLCRCTTPHPEMYIARIGEKFIVKRMPSTGPGHASDCGSFMPPDELSGLAQIHGTAIEENPDDGTTLLRLDFPLSLRGKRPAPPAPSGEATEATSIMRKLTLTSLLHFLWHEADLVKWVPAMTGKRWWGVVQRELKNAAANKIAKKQAVDKKLFVPEPFTIEKKADIAARRNRFFSQLTKESSTATALGILIAEYKSHTPTQLGAKFVFKQLPDCPFFADADLVKRFERVFEQPLILADMVTKSHVMIIATFRMAPAGYPILQDIAMMLTTSNWIPFEHLRDVEVLDAMTEAELSFTKSLRFNLHHTAPMASMIATGLQPPTAMFISAPSSDGETEAALIHAADESSYPSWIWLAESGMPPLPPAEQLSFTTGPHPSL